MCPGLVRLAFKRGRPVILRLISRRHPGTLTLRIDRLQKTTEKKNLIKTIYLYGGGYTSGQIYKHNYYPTRILKPAKADESLQSFLLLFIQSSTYFRVKKVPSQ